MNPRVFFAAVILLSINTGVKAKSTPITSRSEEAIRLFLLGRSELQNSRGDRAT